MYLLTNDEESKLGTTPLPDGVVRVFRDNGRDGLSYLTQQTIKYIPIGDKIELNLGPDPEVIFELIKLRSFRDNIWLQIHGTSEFSKVGDGRRDEDRECNSSPAGTTTRSTPSGSATTPRKPIEVEIRRTLPGPRRLPQPARAEAARLSDGRIHRQGRCRQDGRTCCSRSSASRAQAKQNNVTLETAEIAP